MTLESGRTLGVISSLITVILPVIVLPVVLFLTFAQIGASRTTPISTPFVPPAIVVYGLIGVLGLVSMVLFLVAMRRLADYYNEPAIYKNTLYGFILNIVGVVSGIVFDFVFFTFIISGWKVGVSVPISASIVQQTVIALFGFFAIVFVLAIVGAVFFMRAFNNLADKSGVKGFKDAGLILLIGYALTIVLVGALLVWVAWILAAMAFFSLKPSTNSVPTYQQPTQSTPSPALAQRNIVQIGE